MSIKTYDERVSSLPHEWVYSPNNLLRAEIVELRAALEEIDKWKEKGDFLVKKGDSMGAMFCLGQWWADRPWRTK